MAAGDDANPIVSSVVLDKYITGLKTVYYFGDLDE